MRYKANTLHFQLKVKPRRQQHVQACALELTNSLSCWASYGDVTSTTQCKDAAKRLHECMAKPVSAQSVSPSSFYRINQAHEHPTATWWKSEGLIHQLSPISTVVFGMLSVPVTQTLYNVFTPSFRPSSYHSHIPFHCIASCKYTWLDTASKTSLNKVPSSSSRVCP